LGIGSGCWPQFAPPPLRRLRLRHGVGEVASWPWRGRSSCASATPSSGPGNIAAPCPRPGATSTLPPPPPSRSTWLHRLHPLQGIDQALRRRPSAAAPTFLPQSRHCLPSASPSLAQDQELPSSSLSMSRRPRPRGLGRIQVHHYASIPYAFWICELLSIFLTSHSEDIEDLRFLFVLCGSWLD
jgi:hypothetical protein